MLQTFFPLADDPAPHKHDIWTAFFCNKQQAQLESKPYYKRLLLASLESWTPWMLVCYSSLEIRAVWQLIKIHPPSPRLAFYCCAKHQDQKQPRGGKGWSGLHILITTTPCLVLLRERFLCMIGSFFFTYKSGMHTLTDKWSSGCKSVESPKKWLGLCPFVEHLGVTLYSFPNQVWNDKQLLPPLY